MIKLHSHPLQKILDNRIAIIDGAMGTTIRTYGMSEADIDKTLDTLQSIGVQNVASGGYSPLSAGLRTASIAHSQRF